MSEIVISPTADAAVCSALHTACFDTGWTPDMMDGALKIPHQSAFLATLNGVPVGVLLYTCVAQEAEITTICVLKNYRRAGIGSALLKYAFDAVKGHADSFFLEASVDNVAAIALYRHFGFSQTGVRKNYYQTPTGQVDALTMRADV